MSERPRHVMITGTSRGLGRALAERFAEAGLRVSGCARSAADFAGARVDHDRVDVTHDEGVDRWAARAIERHGAPDLLINNAAIINRNARLWEVPAEEFREVIEVNLVGVANVIRRVLPAMIARGSGVVVNVSSGWGRSTAPEVAPYCATKWAIEGLTRALAQEIPKKLAVVALNPGIIDTEMLRSCFGESAGAYVDPETWSRAAAPFLLGLGPRDNGRSLHVPGQE